MIYTLTTNPAVDINVTSDNTLSNRHVNRTHNAVYTPNGKGVNVSFALEHFGIDSKILGFFGGFSGDFIVDGARKVCEVEPVYIDGITRMNFFVSTPDGEYKFPNAGAPVSKGKQEEMLGLLRQAKDLDCLVVSGSLSPQIEPSYYDELIDVVHKNGADFVLDISHPHLADLVKKRPLLIKPNDDEVAAIFGFDVSCEANILAALEKLHELGTQNVLLTLGGKGAYFSNGEHVWQASAVSVPVLSTACAGDATLASFLSIWYADRNAVVPALTRAMATGANVVMSAGLGNFTKVEEFEREVRIVQVA